jgi:hypothetical protein
MKDEKLYTQFGPIRSGFLATLISKFFDFGRLPSLNRMRYFCETCFKKSFKFNNLSKTGSFVEIFQREHRKIIKLVKKVVKNRRYCTLDSQDRGAKVGFKMKQLG